jgi:addiction module RelE/StbE family toxin
VENVYRLRWKKGIREQLRTLPGRIQEETTQAILNLRDEPYPPDAEELRDHYRGIWKIKIDGWRILYQVDEKALTVTVIAVKRRDPNTYVSLFSVLF